MSLLMVDNIRASLVAYKICSLQYFWHSRTSLYFSVVELRVGKKQIYNLTLKANSTNRITEDKRVGHSMIDGLEYKVRKWDDMLIYVLQQYTLYFLQHQNRLLCLIVFMIGLKGGIRNVYTFTNYWMFRLETLVVC